MDRLDEKKRRLIGVLETLLLSWLGTYGVCYVSSLVSGTYLSNGILSLAVFIVLYEAWKITLQEFANKEKGKAKKKHIIYAWTIAFLVALTLVMGYQLRMNGMTECGFRGKGMIVVRSVFLSMAVFPFSNRLVGLADQCKAGVFKQHGEKMWCGKKVFLICWGILFLSWIPVFMAYYPAVMAYDFHRQSGEAISGFIWFNSHHPLIHTWLIWLFFQIGNALGSLQAGMACYSIFQMLLLSASLSYAAVMVYRLTKRRWALVATVLFFGLFPFVSILSVGATKDVIFSALFVIFVNLLIEREVVRSGRSDWKLDVVIVLEGILMCMFRNNALYAVAAFSIVFVLLAARRERLRVLAMCLILIVGSKGALEGIQLALGTSIHGSDVEKYSVLMQQFARVGYYHGKELDQETYNLLNTYVTDTYWENYYAPLADSVKGSIGVDNYVNTWKGNMPEVIRAWAKIGLKYPNEYIDAFLCLTSGFWFIDDVTWAEVLGYGPEERMGALHTFNSTVSEQIPEGILHESKLPRLESMLEETVSSNSFYRWPVVSNLFKPALYCWILFLSFLLFIYTKQRKQYLVLCYPLLYLMTMFLGPVVQVRYVLPLIVTTPVILAMWKTISEKEVDKV